MKYRNESIRDQEIKVSKGAGYTFFGPDLVVVDSTVEIGVSAKSLGFGEVEFRGCTFSTRKKLGPLSWCDAKLFDCSFRGTFAGNDFGKWPDESEFGDIRSCDFSEAVLDGCQFFGCSAQDLQLPSWPCFCVENPEQNAERMAEAADTVPFKILASVYATTPREVTLATGLASAVGKQLKCGESELRSFVEQFDFIHF